jgi:hypothetical protein
MLVGVALLLLSGGALAIVVRPEGESVALAAGLTAATFATVGIFALLWGGAHTWAASLLRGRAPAGRVLMLALAVVNLLVLPFGTALGAYALWVLLTHEGRQLFQPAHG